jgi:hypothetical protein
MALKRWVIGRRVVVDGERLAEGLAAVVGNGQPDVAGEGLRQGLRPADVDALADGGDLRAGFAVGGYQFRLAVDGDRLGEGAPGIGGLADEKLLADDAGQPQPAGSRRSVAATARRGAVCCFSSQTLA